jgi:UDP-2-acetamido-2-deoxy-ribo-hexuluronate aminotransferase
MSSIPFVDLKSQYSRISARVQENIQTVLHNSDYIGGRFVGELEEKLAKLGRAEHCITCASGTDALILALMCLDVQPGDRVICPSYTFTATAEAIALLKAVPVFVDVDPISRNLDAASLETILHTNPSDRYRGIIAVDIFGQAADYQAIRTVAEKHGLWIVADAAQSFGAHCDSGPVGSLADITTTSFYPAKPLGCYGDGGAIFTDNAAFADRLRSLRNHGQSDVRYHYREIGLCSRLDTIQAGVLLAKLDIFEEELRGRQYVADYYDQHLRDILDTPRLAGSNSSAWAQYTVALQPQPDETLSELSQRRHALVKELIAKGVPSQVYYAPALHEQAPFQAFPRGDMPVTEQLSASTFSLPMHSYLSEDKLATIVDFIRSICHDTALAI